MHAYLAGVLFLEMVQNRCLLCWTCLMWKFTMGSQTSFQQLILKFTHGRLQSVHDHSLSSLQLTHKITHHEAMWLYQAVVAGEEVTLAISKVGKHFTYFLRLQTCW
jgi:hypothetical protein